MALAMYHTLLSSSESVPVSIQRAAVKMALKEKGQDSDSVLIKLAQQVDLDLSVKKLIENCDRAKVRAAWLSRPGLTQDELTTLLKKEKRATVLAKVAEAVETPLHLLEALADDGKPLVCDALLKNNNTPNKALVKAIVLLGESPRSTRNRWEVSRKIAERADLHDEIAKVCGPSVAALLLKDSVNFSDKAIKRLFQVLVLDPLKSALTSVQNRPEVLLESRYSYRNQVRKCVENTLTALDTLSQSTHLTWKEIEKMSKNWTALQLLAKSQNVPFIANGAHATQVLLALEGDVEAKAGFSARESILEKVYIEIKESTDDDLLSETVSWVLGGNDDVNTFAKVTGLCENQSLNGKHMNSYLFSYNNKELARKLCTAMLRNNNGGDDKELAKVIVLLSSSTKDDWTNNTLQHVKSKSKDLFQSTLEFYVEEMLEYPWKIQHENLEAIPEINSIIIAKVNAKQLPQLNGTIPGIIEEINKQICSILGDDPKNWESFSSLAHEVTQPILEVAKAARLLSR